MQNAHCKHRSVICTKCQKKVAPVDWVIHRKASSGSCSPLKGKQEGKKGHPKERETCKGSRNFLQDIQRA